MADPKDDLKVIESVNELGGVDITLPDAEIQAKKPDAAAEDEGVKSLRKQLEDRKRAEADARREADAAEARARAAEAQTAEGQQRLITNSLEAAESRKAQAKRDLIAAAEAGDWAKQADAQEALNEAQIQMDRLAHGKEELDRRVAQEKERPQQRARQAADDPVEAMIANVTPKSGAWLREHPECVTDNVLNAEMIAAHHRALRENIPLESPEYFAFIEKKLGFGADDTAPARKEPATQRERVAAEQRAPAAPPSRGTSPGRGSDNNTVTLSKAEKDFCDESGISYENYARNKIALVKEGRLH